ncbi:Stc1 domain-containing protein [Phaeosphaeria sp. MPI-PUGE-AT-0046c]|nr:Stc1 domain-containing protein [Phaeosphaeria sp. MPI-PUGE-AT-0046c]
MKRQQKHVYDPNEIESLKGILIPAKIKCGRCSKNLPQVKYSTKQLTDFCYQVKTQGRITKDINCHNCSGGAQVVELECTMCHKTKGQEDFARSQWAKPDTARCFKCTDNLVKQKPIDHDRYAIGNRPFVTPDEVNGHKPEYWSSAGSTAGSEAAAAAWADYTSETRTETDALSSDFKPAMSVKSLEDLIGSEFSVPNSKDAKKAESWHTPSTGKSTCASSIKTGGWAKIPAYTGGPVLPHGDAQREMDANWGSEDESSEEEANDDDDSDGEFTVV